VLKQLSVTFAFFCYLFCPTSASRSYTLQLNPPRKSATPAFATHLGLLEPKKAVPDPFGSASADTAAPHGNLPFSLVSSICCLKNINTDIQFCIALHQCFDV